MQIVIDIPEGLKQKIDEGFTSQVITSKLWDAVKNATPLTDCTDAISRRAVIESALNVPIAPIVDGDKVTVRRVVFLEDVLSLPSVNPNTETEAFLNGKKCGYELGQFEKNLEWKDKLERIRAEIEEIPKKYPMTMDYENGLKEALGIIDKYSKGGDSDA